MVHSNKEKRKQMNTNSLKEHARPLHGKKIKLENKVGSLKLSTFYKNQ
jgi:hypothetical protein